MMSIPHRNPNSQKNIALRKAHDEIRRLQGALRDVQNPLEYLRRYAAGEGAKLNGNACAIANELGFVQRIAREALEEDTPIKPTVTSPPTGLDNLDGERGT